MAAIEIGNAIVLVEWKYFFEKLSGERKWLTKRIKDTEASLKRKRDLTDEHDLKRRRMQLAPLDSVYKIARSNRLDTFHVSQQIFYDANSAFGDFLPRLIAEQKCIVLDSGKQKQDFLVKIKAFKKTGPMTAVGNSFYFIPGTTSHFLVKMDWVN